MFAREGYSICDKLGAGLLDPVRMSFDVPRQLPFWHRCLKKKTRHILVWQRKYHALLICLGSFGTYLVVTAFQFQTSHVVQHGILRVISVLLGYFVLQKSVSMARWLSLATITIGLGLLPWA